MNTSRSAHATAAAAASSSSSRRSNNWKHEVFLSLGDDTRTTFTDHLSIALRDAGINTGYQLKREENIRSELDGEIEGSRIAIVVFSKRYAESGCCLRELSKIMKCREDQDGKVVYPIFYDVDPSQVRKQSGSFEEAFRKHEREEDPNEVEQWRKDLKACADLCGRNLADGREGLFIKNVVGDIIALTKTRDLQTSQSTTRLEYLSALFATAAGSSSSRRSNRWKYEVFLSFIGEDTRTAFTDHLLNALSDAGINTFIGYQLRRGEHIQSELDREIEGSRIAVVVFSKSYAESRWCLRELSKIMGEGKVVYPIFYDVDPSEVRNQSGSFGEPFQKHEKDEDPNEVEQWRRDLKACADLSGRNFNTTADGYKFKFPLLQNLIACNIISQSHDE